MKLHLSSYFWILITILGLIQTFRLNFVSTRDLRQANEKDNWFLKQKQDTIPAKLVHAGLRNATQMGDSAANIFYFIQVSDLHISKFQPKGHTIHFLHFLQSTLPVIKPEFVVVTGDLVDAKDQTRTVSAQHPEEWQVYKSAVEQGANTTKWYDMRGNHDCFDLVDWQAENNMYKTFGESAKLLDDGKGVYSWQVSKSFGEYNFVVVDSCPKKGPSRPFNFFGYLTTNTMNRLVSKIMSNSYNHTFLFSHYPTTTMLTGKSTEGYTFGDLANHFSIYFCGHLHRLTAGLGDVLKSYSKSTDSLELELSDMKDHGSYRIIAVDHDMISFVDIDLPIDEIPPALAEETIPLTETNKIVWPKKIKPAPVILITNPKDSRFTMPSKEPLQNVRKSSHIRFLVFTEYEPTELRIKVFMDDKHHPFPAKFVGSMKDNMPLWTTLWEPNDFDDYSTHTLRIEVTSPDGQTGTSQVPFRMDNMRMKIQGGVGEWVIWSNMAKLVSDEKKK
ncbi:Metallo-dependent phosphatase-like protein [Mucor mucedo]|uniref:Metallo-dependent phosphatase-like protein n=1 Tax=Mucor mucedo TaxID=29922 RepID=UPI00221F55BB|nr:Metallo-dependent phosphatase-like protein [Mucor mucedo]KAI7897094.1 Metallo-dependent phosphatase-like protein [Mucor mucedo]